MDRVLRWVAPLCDLFHNHTFCNTRAAFVTTRVFSGMRFAAATLFRDDLRKIFKPFDVPIRAVASIFRQIPFGTAGGPAPPRIVGDHNPISNEISRSV
jgi:hypothetical protein